jgi:hypothetical protein
VDACFKASTPDLLFKRGSLATISHDQPLDVMIAERRSGFQQYIEILR